MRIEDVSNSELSALIDEWVRGRNAVRNREILKLRLIDGMTYSDLAEKFGLSFQRVTAIVYKEQDKIFRHFE